MLPPSRRPEAAGKLGVDFLFIKYVICIRPRVDLGVLVISTDLIDLIIRNTKFLLGIVAR